ncbi:MAG: hypothetical protein P1V20_27915 [Verrucomicrobiales bacterium]|nr:hypothetical protein [Verrucomicrobiales bacterium]
MSEPKEIYTTRTGPWGKLEYYYSYLDSPDGFFRSSTRETTEWGFIGHNRGQVEDFLFGCGVDVTELNRDCRWIEAQNGTIVSPSNRFVATLSAEVRQTLYPAHLKLMENATHLNEFVIERSAYRENTMGLNIPEEIIKLVEERSVKMGKKTIFTETAFALSQIPDPTMKLKFLKSLARNRAVLAKLRITPDSDVEKIASWWKAGPNRTRSLPLLENALRIPGGDSVDIIHLLPPVPRQLLNTFPTDTDEFDGRKPDCYWAAMNFFSETASNRYLDKSLPREYYFLERFKRLPRGSIPQFGDAVILADRKRNHFVHAYVHIADDIVYTKNGKGKIFPYILMRRDDLISRYQDSSDLGTDIYRLKTLN